jgi:hypothetical protein
MRNCGSISSPIRVFAGLPRDEQVDIEAQARTYACTFTGSLRDHMYTSRKAQITGERHSEDIKSFDQWLVDQPAA